LSIFGGIGLGLAKVGRREKSVFYSWVLSYTAIVIVCVIISGVAYVKSLDVVESEINRSNAAMIKQLQITLDGYIRDIINLTNTLSVNPKVNNFISREKPFSESDMYDLLEINRDCRLYKFGNSFIEALCIYYKNSDTGISSNGTYNGRMLFDSLEFSKDYSYEGFMDFLNRRHTNDLLTLTSRNTAGELINTIIYAQSLPMSNTLLPKANIIVFIDNDRFQGIIRNIQLENDGNVMVLAADDTVMGSVQPAPLSEPLHYAKLTGSSGRLEQVYNGEEYVLSYVRSQICNWKYISMIPTSIFKKKISDVQRLIVVSVAVCLILGIFLAYYFTRRNYNPVNELLRTFTVKTGSVEYQKGHNEFKFIGDSFRQTYEEKEIIQKRLAQNHGILRENLIARLLRGRTGDRVSLDDALSYMNIGFTSDYFAVLLFDFTDYGELAEEDRLNEEELKLIHFVMTNVVEELAGHKNQGFMTEIDEMMACLINFKSSDYQSSLTDLERIANEAKQFLQDHFNMTMTIAISGIHEMLPGISQAYMESLEALEYKVVMGSTSIIKYEDIKNTAVNTVSYNYNMQTEQKLINLVKASDYESARDLINEIFTVNLMRSFLSVGMVRCLMMDLVCTMTKTMDEIGGNTDRAFFEKLNPVEMLLKCETVTDMKKSMLKVLRSFCDYIGEKKKSHNVKLKEELLQYLGSSYYEAEMNIETVAAHFSMNPVYLSRFFKEQMGESMLDYINKLRLEKAKQLLRDRRDNIGDIALKSGFYNHGTFIRIFKKYEGITPKGYMEALKFNKKEGDGESGE
jgi:YesN/AraC family two-component response regulator